MDTTKTSQSDEDATWNQELKSLLRFLIAQSVKKTQKHEEYLQEIKLWLVSTSFLENKLFYFQTFHGVVEHTCTSRAPRHHQTQRVRW